MLALTADDRDAVAEGLSSFERTLPKRIVRSIARSSARAPVDDHRVFRERVIDDANLQRLRELAGATETVGADVFATARQMDLIAAYETITRKWGCAGQTAWAAWAQTRYEREADRLPDCDRRALLEDAYAQALELAD